MYTWIGLMWNSMSAKKKTNTFCISVTDPSASVLSVASPLITESNVSFAKSSICLAMDDIG